MKKFWAEQQKLGVLSYMLANYLAAAVHEPLNSFNMVCHDTPIMWL